MDEQLQKYRLQADNAFTLGAYNTAIRLYSEIISRTGTEEHALLLNNRANAYSALGRHIEAIADLHTALTLEPENAIIHFNLATIFLAQKNLSLALKNCWSAITLNPHEKEYKIFLTKLLRLISMRFSFLLNPLNVSHNDGPTLNTTLSSEGFSPNLSSSTSYQTNSSTFFLPESTEEAINSYYDIDESLDEQQIPHSP